MRNTLSNVPKTAQPMVAAAIRAIFARPDQVEQLGRVADSLEPRFPRVTSLLHEAQEDVLAFPTEHHRQIRSTNPLERLNRELKRRADVRAHLGAGSAGSRLVVTSQVYPKPERTPRAGAAFAGIGGRQLKRYIGAYGVLVHRGKVLLVRKARSPVNLR